VAQVYYFEHYLREGGVVALGGVTILSGLPGDWCKNLRDEILDVFPEARIDISSTPTHEVDLLVIPITRDCCFPFHDALYDSLDDLLQHLDVAAYARFVMLYRVNWREVEVVRASHFAKILKRRRFERVFIRLFKEKPLLRRLLAPLYPN